MARPRLPRLLTLDAFGTIFHPKQPIAQQYVAEAVAHGLQGLNESAIAATFRDGEKKILSPRCMLMTHTALHGQLCLT